jgi:DNA-binding SARP family transcriptional activator/DNA-binding XRE family transcriptional regulator
MIRSSDLVEELPVGWLIRQHRLAAGWTQRELADRAGLSIGSLRDLEQGRTLWPRWGSIEALVAALGLQLGQHPRLMPAREPVTGGAGPAVDDQIGGPVGIGILGPLALSRAGRPVRLGSERQRAVLAMLALAANHRVRVGEFIEVLWPRWRPPTAVTMVQGYISTLRRLLESQSQLQRSGDVVLRTGDGYQLQAGEACQVDVHEFTRLAQAGREAMDQGQPAGACELLGRALSLGRGPTLNDIDLLLDHPAVIEVNVRRSDAVLRYADAAAMTGADDRALPHIQALCASQSLNEPAFARLIKALVATGQRAKAAEAFEELRVRLDTELGLRPSDQVIAAYSDVLAAESPR